MDALLSTGLIRMNTIRYTRPQDEQNAAIDDTEPFTSQADLINELIYRLTQFTGQTVTVTTTNRPYPSWMQGWSWSEGEN